MRKITERIAALIEPLLTPMHEQHLQKEVWTNLNKIKAILATSFLPAQMKELREIEDSHKDELAFVLGYSDCIYLKADVDHFKIDYTGKRDCHVYIAYDVLPYKAVDYLRSVGYNIPNNYSVPAAVSAEEVLKGLEDRAVSCWLHSHFTDAEKATIYEAMELYAKQSS